MKKYWKNAKKTGKVREKSGKFVSPKKWEPCQDILSHYSGCFEGIGHFPGELYKFYLNLNKSLQDMLQGKFQSILKLHSKKKSSLW